MWIRLSLGVRGSTSVRGDGVVGRCIGTATFTGLSSVNSGSTVEPGHPPVTTVRFGTTSAGRISTAICLASRRDR
jgi:hypothetical protein